jgi:hypothetical protein
MKTLLLFALLLCNFAMQSQNRAIVVPTKNLNAKMIAESEAMGCKTIQHYEQLDWYLIDLPESMSFESYKRKIGSLVQQVYPDLEMVYHRDYIVNDPYFVQSWHLKQSNDADVDADEAWDLLSQLNGYTTVAVFDGGLETAHPDLIGRWNNPFNAVTSQPSAAFVNSYDKHGTACSGTIAATVNNAIGVAGIGGNYVQVMPINIMSNVYSGGSFSTTAAIQVNAVNAAMANPTVAAISMSYGGSNYSAALEAAFEIAKVQGRGGKGILIFASSGNGYSGTANQYPANYINVWGVGATSSADLRSSFSNYGPICDISAPGSGIWTTDRLGADGYSATSDYASVSGTSFSCPITAAAAALMAYKNNDLTSDEIYGILSGTCDKVGGYAYSQISGYPFGTRSNELGYGRINLKNALIAAGNGELPPPPPAVQNLFLSNLVVSPTNLVIGSAISVGFNAGAQIITLPSAETLVECRLSTDNVWSANDAVLFTDTVVLGGGISTLPLQFSYAPQSAGTFYVIAKINGNASVIESTASDNTVSSSFTVTDPAAIGIDAAISLITPIGDVTLTTATVFNAKWKITNTGTTTITSFSTGRKWLVCNGAIWSCNETITNWTGNLLPGQSVILPNVNGWLSINACTSSANCQVPAGTSNTYQIRLASINGSITDAVPGNNTVSILVSRPLPTETFVDIIDLQNPGKPAIRYENMPTLLPGFYAVYHHYSDNTFQVEKLMVE